MIRNEKRLMTNLGISELDGYHFKFESNYKSLIFKKSILSEVC